MSKVQVWITRRKTGEHKVCPRCGARAPATGRDCRCGADLRKVPRSVKKGWTYAVRWADPRTGKVKSEAVGSDKTYARHVASQRRQELLTGQYKGLTVVSWDEFTREHLETVAATLSEASYNEHERALNQFKAACSPKDPTVVDFAMLEKFRAARLADGVTPATVNKCLRTLQAALERAVKRGYIHVNPFKGQRMSLFIREAEKNPVTLEPADFPTLIDACPNDDWRAMATIGYFAGLRLGEAVSLEWDCVDFEANMLRVVNTEEHATKSRKIRLIPMSAEVLGALKALVRRRFQDKHVFRFGRTDLSKVFVSIAKAAGLDVSFHDLRRSFVTNLLESGADPKTVQTLAGHANIQTTMKHYAGVRAKSMAGAITKMSQFTRRYESRDDGEGEKQCVS